MSRMVEQLRALAGGEELRAWSDQEIVAGGTWEPEIRRAIESADAGVLLISAAFLTSSYIQREEVPSLLERRRRDGLVLMPLIVEPCPWQENEWLHSLQVRPRGARPLSTRPRAQADVELAALASEVKARLQRGTLPYPLGRPADVAADRAPRYLCYLARERLQELFEQLDDRVLMHHEPNGALGELSLGPPRGAAADAQRARGTVRRLAIVGEELRRAGRIADLNAIVRDRGRLASEWYEVEGEFCVPSWEASAPAVDLVTSLGELTLQLSCAKRNFTGLSLEAGEYIPTSTSRFLFEGDVALPMRGVVRLAGIDAGRRTLRGAPLYMVLNPLAFDLGELADVGL
jgi:hypothetical protein